MTQDSLSQESLSQESLSQDSFCDHIEDGFDYTDEGLVYTRFTYCPKCGEKL